jgi:hypothetical protein
MDLKKSTWIQFEGNITVNTMKSQAGIFIGERNNAVGWSAHSKTNQVLGEISGQSNLFTNNVLLLNDPDIIDTPIDDRDVNINVECPGEKNSTSLSLESVNVTTMTQNSSMFLGKGHVTGMDANEKENYGQGSIYGDQNNTFCNLNINNDPDLIDAIIEDQDIKINHMQKE